MNAPTPRVITPRPLSREAFRPFGDVVEVGATGGSSANQGSATRYDFAARLASSRPDARPNLAVFRSVRRALPFELRLLERHPCSSQAFLPMRAGRLLVCVAPSAPDGAPDAERIEAFLGAAGQGVNYLAGVWHHPIVALDADADLAMLAWEDGSPRDCEEHWFESPRLVVEP